MPGPGSKRMKPKGLVAAASMTSQTSISSRSQSCASSLTRAMLTERKMFSSSFASSAGSGPESDDDLVADLAVELRGPLGALVGQAADDLRGGADRVVGAARVDPLGREGEVEVARRPSCPTPRGSAAGARGWCPGRSSTRATTSCPVCRTCGERARGVDQVGEVGLARAGQRGRHADDHRVAARPGPRSAVVARRRSASGSRSPIGDVLDVAVGPRRRASILRGSASRPITSWPSSANATASGSPT